MRDCVQEPFKDTLQNGRPRGLLSWGGGQLQISGGRKNPSLCPPVPRVTGDTSQAHGDGHGSLVSADFASPCPSLSLGNEGANREGTGATQLQYALLVSEREGVTRDPLRGGDRGVLRKTLTPSSAPHHTSFLPPSASLGAKFGLLIFCLQ